MFDAPSEHRTTVPFCSKLLRKQRQRPDSDALAYGYIHPDEIFKPKHKRALSPRSPRKMYSQQAYGQPPPARFYQNESASQSYVSSRRRQPPPYRSPWVSESTLELPRQRRGTSEEGWHSSSRLTSPPPKSPRPAGKRVHFPKPQANHMTERPTVPQSEFATRPGGWGADFGPPENHRKPPNEELWIQELDRELCLVEQEEQQEEQLEAERSASRNDKFRHQDRGGLINYSKTWMFANSRLPPHQLPFKTYFETWRLICRAARSSAQVYQRPKPDQREHFIAADRRHRTKAMVLKSTPLDDQNLIVFSIRGSQVSYFDWNTNLQPAPAAPEGFLDDGLNACHSGFLKVAKAMVAPVAARLRQLLEQDPSRCASSLLITGHSAGGAVASLLYMHMLATSVESELTLLAGCFKRVHCITFGAPPISFLPLEKPDHMRASKSLFLSFVNEGDIVVRADKAYLISLAKILAGTKPPSHPSVNNLAKKASRVVLGSTKPDKERAPYWPVPEAPLSNAGRLIVLREKPGAQVGTSIEAVVSSDQKMRDVVFGDPAMHAMSLYQRRVESLAFAAMLGDED